MKHTRFLALPFFLLLGLIWAFTSAPKAKTVVFFGDSITQAAVQPGGYIDILNQELAKKGKSDEYNLVGAGISGNKVPDLQKRIATDVLAKNPDLVFIYIGINDVWHFTHPCCKDKAGGTAVEPYEAGLKDIINQIKASGAKVILCTPSVIGEKTDGGNAEDAMLDQYAAISRKVARDTKVKLCDLRKAFTAHLKERNTENAEQGILTTDRVHLNAAGNRFVAEQMLTYLK
ncbi:SGNH/GDSL hydrolase family protein [Adhaeribacter radiodurans]|uniref:SGNH/GDSL hydrolase family protein n=1 Tax=Adhaeribacter radiodurans TaxID=2745197 RepID=A0A7L7LBC6_9BACT|nr:SGNH/GDSL hydrolase family protein [Adhaeribacter radiodurans]QMU29855.1 SGNH/GDSL hydrolase family protein [Adhaeribacter radiodurans]